MFCINCFHSKTQVTNSRPQKKQPSIWRRRHCPSCGTDFTTYENIALDELLLIVKADKKMPYNRGKLLASLIDALRPTGDDLSQAYWLVVTIEEKLLSDHKARGAWQKIESTALATLAYQTLLAYNRVAGLSYGTSHGLVSMGQKRGRGRPGLNY